MEKKKSETYMKRDLGWFEWYVEVQIYMPLEVKAKFESKMGRSNLMCLSNYQ